MAFHNTLGQIGEKEAAEFLIKKGFTIRETNWRMNKLEVDIIAEENNVLHIIEVKTRTSDLFDPMKAITKQKIKNLVNAANVYIQYNKMRCEVQYDVIILVGNIDELKLEYYPNVFYPPLRTYR
jgi:putative endonuclease